MKAEFLKIAGVKSEAEFYKKFPSEEAFMKKHGKAVKNLMVKKAQVGTMIPNIQTPQSNVKPIRIDNEYLYDAAANLTGKKTMQEMKDESLYQAEMLQASQSNNNSGGGMGNIMSMLGPAMSMLGGGGGGDMGVNLGAGMDGVGMMAKYGGQLKKAQSGQNVGDTMNSIFNSRGVQEFGLPIISDVMDISKQIKAQKEQLAQAKQNRMMTEIALDAAKSQPERIERKYVRPEDIENTGEEFFPIYGVGTNVLARNGGMFSDVQYSPIVDPNQQKAFKQGGVLGSNSYLVKAQGGGGISYGGGQAGQLGMQFGNMVGFNNDAGSNIGGKIGGTVGSIFGPVGSAVGSFIGSGVGDLIDRNDRRQRIENKRAQKAAQELAYTTIAPAIQAGYSSHLKSGGNISSNPTMLNTMAMGGDVKTLWGGDVETVSYNPYAGGESIQFKGNSHDYRDPKTGETGIGVAYGEQSVANNTPVVEVENEPAQKLRDGGGSENLVVYGDLKIPEEYIPEISDDRAKGMKFKNYVTNVLNKDESKINKKMEKAADKGLESDNTIWGQLERSTANAIIDGGDMKLKNIAEKKNILANLQSALNETFDELAIKGNEFISKNKIVEDPEKAMNNMAKYGKEVPKAQDGLTTVKYKSGQLPKTNKTPEELIADGYVQDENNPNIYVKYNGEIAEAVESSGSSKGYTPQGQKIDPKTGLAGDITIEQINELEENNPWFGKFDLNKPKVKWKGKMVHPDVLRFQQEFNKRIEGTEIEPIKTIDGVIGQETFNAKFTPAVEGREPAQERVMVEESDPTTTTDTTTVDSKKIGFPFMNYQPKPVRGGSLDPNQLLGEYAALSSNVLEPVYAQTFQPRLRVPYDISLQAAKNDVIAQSRALERNPALQNNPAALALAQAPTYSALNQINEQEFIANQKMKDDVYSQNLDQLNKADLINLGIYDTQQERQAQAAANTKATTLAALNSISSKYAQKKLQNRMEQVYANMYPTYTYNKNFQTEVQQPTTFNIPGMGTVSSMATPGFNPALQQIPGFLGMLNNVFQQQQQYRTEQAAKKAEENLYYEPIETGVEEGKKGKTVKKNNKNSNILKTLRGL